jgi:excisionase family DNA binding protein
MQQAPRSPHGDGGAVTVGGGEMPAAEYSPTQVAHLLRVSTRTVLRWFDSGRLTGYRQPRTQRRRIPHGELVGFLKRHGLPLGPLQEPPGPNEGGA